MRFFQWEQNPWGQEILVRASWDLVYLSFLAGALFIVGHLVFRAKNPPETPPEPSGDVAASIPDKVVRHPLASRLFHWSMAASMLVLLGTGFFPVLGIQFDWIRIHWMAGLFLVGTIVFHLVHTFFFFRWRDIWISAKDWAEWKQGVQHALGSGEPPPKPGKYPVDNRIFHGMVAITAFGVMISGLLMMMRVENPIFARNPYAFSDGTWGLVYVIHGLSAIGFIGMTMAHVYFAVLPEKRWMTISMIAGWITKKDYLAHHDPERWVVSKEASK